jgi:DNA-binding GntR family transcriptional regulator
MAESTKRDQIAQRLRRAIVSGEVPRGRPLRQDELAAEFGVSITPVREALRLLESEHLVVSEPNKGVRVAGIDVDAITAAYILRRLAESFAIRKAIYRMSPRDFDALRALLDEAESSEGSPSFDAYEANRRFHFAFYERCGIPELTKRIDSMWAGFPWDLMLSEPDRTAASNREHREILRAAASGDVDGAARALESHLAHGMAALRVHLTGAADADPFDVD